MGSRNSTPRTGTKTGTPKNGIIVRDAVAEDCKVLGPKLRENDVAELQAGLGLAPIPALEYSHSLSEISKTLLDPHGEIICMCGAIPVEEYKAEPAANVWMLTSPLVKKYPIAFSKVIKAELSRVSNIHGVLFVVIDARNTESIKWLRRIGFKAVSLIPEYGPGKLPFFELAGVF